MEDWVNCTRRGFTIIRDSLNKNERTLQTTHPDVVSQLFHSVIGTIKATKAEKILSNVETVALQLALHINVRGFLLLVKLTKMQDEG